MAKGAYTIEERFVTANEIKFMRENGVSLAKIAAEYGVTRDAVCQRLRTIDRAIERGLARGLRWE